VCITKVLINIVSTIVYIHAPLNRSILPQPLRPVKAEDFVWLEKGTGAAGIMLYQPCIGRARMETRPQGNMRDARVYGHLILRSSKGKEGTGQKGT